MEAGTETEMAALRNKNCFGNQERRGESGRAHCNRRLAGGRGARLSSLRPVPCRDAESLVADIRSKEGRGCHSGADLGTPEGATQLAKGGSIYCLAKRLDVLVSNAGISKAATIMDHTLEGL